MPCCGKTTRPGEDARALTRQRGAGGHPPATTAPARREVVASSATFEQTRASGLTVIGPVTGRRYHFAGEGARLSVDGRDAPSLAAVPGLRRAASSSG